MEQLVDNFVAVNGKHYYDVNTFAEITKRSPQAIRLLINKGNKLQKLQYIKISNTLLVPKSELTAFPFCCSGRSRLVIRFREDGSEYSEIRNGS